MFLQRRQRAREEPESMSSDSERRLRAAYASFLDAKQAVKSALELVPKVGSTLRNALTCLESSLDEIDHPDFPTDQDFYNQIGESLLGLSVDLEEHGLIPEAGMSRRLAQKCYTPASSVD